MAVKRRARVENQRVAKQRAQKQQVENQQIQQQPEIKELLSRLFTAHPWHGISPGDDAPEKVTSYIEIVPLDPVKYELDKQSGRLRLDRPQRFSSVSPTLYGFIPQTYCGPRVAKRCSVRTGLGELNGDGDPMDICVLSDRTFSHGNFLGRVRPIGGLRMIDGNEADDKIIAVLEGDTGYGQMEDINSLPAGWLDRIKHYFLTYKQLPGVGERKVTIAEVYNRDEAREVILASMADYRDKFGAPEERLGQLADLLSDVITGTRKPAPTGAKGKRR